MLEGLLKRDYDAVVVGTGPGGATVAKELTGRGQRVLLLEWGSADPIRGNFRQYFSEQLVPGKSMLFTHKLLGMVRGITTGGSSLFYYGTAFPVPLNMLASHGIHIQEEVDEARRELPIAPLKDEMMTPMATRIMESARSLGYNWNKLDKFMYQDRWDPSFAFGYYGDPHGVKWSARMFVEEAVRDGAVLIDRARVERVLFENGKATGVQFRRKGRDYTVSGRKIVLSAGGIGSPVILRACGVPDVGYDYFFDPLISVCGTVEDLKKQKNEIPMSAGVHMHDQGYMMTDMALPTIVDMIFTAQVFRFHRLLAYPRTLRIMIKARDSLGGRLTDRGGVRKRLAQSDVEKLRDGQRRATEILKNAGAKNVYRTWYLAAHPGGTVKLGEHVDANLRTRFENLHVCDCSVIPEPWGLPPTLPLIGLGKHLARVLAGEKATGRTAMVQEAVTPAAV